MYKRQAERLYTDVTDVLGGIRRERALQKQPFRIAISRARISAPERLVAAVRRAELDIRRAANIEVLDLQHGEALHVELEFASAGADGQVAS